MDLNAQSEHVLTGLSRPVASPEYFISAGPACAATSGRHLSCGAAFPEPPARAGHCPSATRAQPGSQRHWRAFSLWEQVRVGAGSPQGGLVLTEAPSAQPQGENANLQDPGRAFQRGCALRGLFLFQNAGEFISLFNECLFSSYCITHRARHWDSTLNRNTPALPSENRGPARDPFIQ